MNGALALSALMLGLAGSPHCAAMCGPSCVAITRGGWTERWAFHMLRGASYAAAGALVASSVGALAALGALAPAVRPLWTLLHAAALMLGLWLMWFGRQPVFLERIGQGASRPALAGGWQRMKGPTKAATIGAAWVAWPCGLLQSALVVAALADSAAGGAAVMAVFAAATLVGLTVGPWLLAQLGGADGGAVWATRLAGAVLAAASANALWHDLWAKLVAFCVG